MANYYRMKAMDLHNEICNAIAQIIPAEGIVFNAALRDKWRTAIMLSHRFL